MRKPLPRISEVLPQSPAAKLQIKAGEILVSINGFEPRDMIDYQFHMANEIITIVIENETGQRRSLTVEKDYEDDLGLGFSAAVFDGIRPCRNHCLFCFVDQMPKGYRKTLYVKDDDYRLSFLYGNYITLTNFNEEDFLRLEKERLSPLYISIHCTDEALRASLLGVKEESPISAKLRRLVAAGIEIHGQIVLVPGYNDGSQLEKTINDLQNLGAGILSLALVPVGLTKYQNPLLRGYTREEAESLIIQGQRWQQEFKNERGSNFIFFADEFYLLADMPIPPAEEYEDYPQIENGVGIIRQFYEEIEEGLVSLPPKLEVKEKIVIITAVEGEKALTPVLKNLRKLGYILETLVVENKFFGETVTVTGLLTGGDIIAGLREHAEKNCIYLLPDIVLKHHSDVLLDDVSVQEIKKAAAAPLKIVGAGGTELLEAIIQCGKE